MYLTWGIRSNLTSIKFTWGFNGLTSQKVAFIRLECIQYASPQYNDVYLKQKSPTLDEAFFK